MGEKRNPGVLLECKLMQPLRKTVWRFLKKKNENKTYDPAIPLLHSLFKANKNTNSKLWAPPRSLQHYLQYLRHANNLSAH